MFPTREWSRDEVEAWLEAGLLDPSEGETEEPSLWGAGDHRSGQMSIRKQLRRMVEEEKIDGYKPQRKGQAHGGSSTWCFARGSSLASKTVWSVLRPRGGGARGKLRLPTTRWSPSTQEAVALMTMVNSAE